MAMGEPKWRTWTSWHLALIDKGGQGDEERSLPPSGDSEGMNPAMLTWQPTGLVGWLIAKLLLLLLLRLQLREVCEFAYFRSAVIHNFN